MLAPLHKTAEVCHSQEGELALLHTSAKHTPRHTGSIKAKGCLKVAYDVWVPSQSAITKNTREL
jgi:hypothetical protein